MRLITISAAILLGSALSAANAQQLGASNTPAKGPLQKGLNGRGLGNMIVGGGSDTCGTATAISGPGPFAGDNLGANTDGPAACGAIGADVWYNWTANSTGSTIASLCGSGTNYDSVLQIFDTAACTGTSLGCNDDFCGLVSQVTFNAVNGNVYKVRVGGFASSTGSYSLTFSAPPPPPTNDECTSPLPAVTGVNAFNNTAATTSAQCQTEGACLFFGSMAIDHDTWWTWTAPGTGTATVQLCGGQTTIDSKVSAFDGTGCPSGATLACNDDFCGLQSQISFPVTNGSPYTIQLGTFPGAAGGSGTFTISFSGPPPPSGPCDILHDGSTENSVGVNNTAFDILWIHSQGETGVTTVVKSISTAWGSLPFGGGPPNGTPARVGIWSDPNGDRNPTDAVLIASANTVVAGSNTDALQTVQISPSVLVTGRYFIGASCTGGTFQAPLDQTTAPGAGFVWIVGDASGTINYNSIGTSSIPPLDEDNVAPGHWLLQGDCKDIDITEFCGVTAPGDCPCGNDGLIGNGCANSVNAAGAHLSGAGNPIVSADNVSVSASGVRRGNPTLGLFFSGSEVAPAPVNDGLLCAGAPICRLWTWSIPGPGGGTITLTGPDASTIPPNVSISQRSADLGRAISNGETRVYTVWYRDPANFACASPAVSNYTNALRILWSL